jgi:hypothetical protein
MNALYDPQHINALLQLIAMQTGMPRRAAGDWTDRLPPAAGSADPNMVAQPYANPGYAMPSVDQGNLNQSPNQQVLGYLPAAWSRPQQ